MDCMDKPHPKQGMGETTRLRYENKICPPPALRATSSEGGQKLKLQNTPPRRLKDGTPQEGNFNAVHLRHSVPPPPKEDRSSSCKTLPPRRLKDGTPLRPRRIAKRGEF